jgi:DNA-directed RNA polymerase subunit RPC12/RpoP
MDDSRNAMSDMAIITKVCITCNKELPIYMFGERRYRSNKPDAHWIYTRYGECKDCSSKRKALWRKANQYYMKEWYKKHKQIKLNNNEI